MPYRQGLSLRKFASAFADHWEIWRANRQLGTRQLLTNKSCKEQPFLATNSLSKGFVLKGESTKTS